MTTNLFSIHGQLVPTTLKRVCVELAETALELLSSVGSLGAKGGSEVVLNRKFRKSFQEILLE